MTVLSQAAAVDEMTKLARAIDPAIALPGKPFSRPNVTDRWARLSFNHAIGSQASLAGVNGTRKFRSTGVLLIEVHYPLGSPRQAYEWAGEFSDAFEGVGTDSGIWFRDVIVSENNDRESGWFRLDVVATFEYDRLK